MLPPLRTRHEQRGRLPGSGAQDAAILMTCPPANCAETVDGAAFLDASRADILSADGLVEET